MIQLPALPPSSVDSPTAPQELALARDAHEHAVLLALRAHDEAALERAFVALRAFYGDTRATLGASPSEPMMLGLNLLRLLAQNRVAEFHAELERLPPACRADAYVQAALRLEQWLTEGAYNKVLAAGAEGLPPEFAGYYAEALAATVRDEIAGCSEAAYAGGGLALADAQRLLALRTPREAADFAAQRGWEVRGDRVLFGARAARRCGGEAAAAGGGGGGMDVDGADAAAAAAGGALAASSMALIRNTLVYAKELERIV